MSWWEARYFCLDKTYFLPKSRDHTILRLSLDLAGLDLEGGYCYGCNTNVKCRDSNSMVTKGYVKEGLELALMGSFNVEQGGCQLQT